MLNPQLLIQLLGGLGQGGQSGGFGGVGTPGFNPNAPNPMNPFPMPGMQQPMGMPTPGDPNDPLVQIRQLIAQLQAQQNEQGPLGKLLGKIPGVGGVLGNPAFQQIALAGLAAAKPQAAPGIAQSIQDKRQRKDRSQYLQSQLQVQLARLEQDKKDREALLAERKAEREERMSAREEERLLSRLRVVIGINPDHPSVQAIGAKLGIPDLTPQQKDLLRIALDDKGGLVPVAEGGLPVKSVSELMSILREQRQSQKDLMGLPNAEIAQLEQALGRPLTEAEKQRKFGIAPPASASGSAPQRRPLSETAEAALISRLSKEWTKAAEPTVELNRQARLMQLGLDAARRGDMAAGSQAVLVTFQKILDPTSVVRESEYARSAEGQSLLSRIEGAYDRLVKGGAGVPLSELEKFATLANQAVDTLSTGYLESVKSRIEKTADRYEIPHELVITDLNLAPSAENSVIMVPMSEILKQAKQDGKTPQQVIAELEAVAKQSKRTLKIEQR